MPPKNFFGPEEWIRHLYIDLSADWLKNFVDFPWTKEFLESPCPFFPARTKKETHFAFLGIQELGETDSNFRFWRSTFPVILPEKSVRILEMAPEPYHKILLPRWFLILKSPIPDSQGKTFSEQMEMLPPGYEVPSVAAELAKNLLHFRLNGKPPSIWPVMGRCGETVNPPKTIFTDDGPASVHPALWWREEEGKRWIEGQLVDDKERSEGFFLSAAAKLPSNHREF